MTTSAGLKPEPDYTPKFPPSVIIPPTWTPSAPLDIQSYFPSPAPLEIDVGSGKGRFLTTRARKNPGTNYIGIERLLERIRKTHRKIERAGLTNVRLLRVEAAYAVRFFLPPESVTAYFVFFPDPWPKRRHQPRRLFNPEFLDNIHRTLRGGGVVNAATDHMDYFAAIEKLFGKDPRFRRVEPYVPTDDERTEFEEEFLGQSLPIGRCAYAKV